MRVATKINGKYKSTLEAMDRMDYNCCMVENVYFLKRVVNCLKKERSREEINQVIKQIENRIIECQDTIKITQGAEGYPGLMIKR